MRFFLTSETSGKAYYYCHIYQQEIGNRLAVLESKNYGNELIDIMIVAIIEHEPIWSDRKLFQRKDKAADIRLHIPYKPFIIARPEKKFEMLANHTIMAVQTLKHRLSKDFDYDGLIRDISVLLPENTVVSNK